MERNLYYQQQIGTETITQICGDDDETKRVIIMMIEISDT
jgi:hypothetical protein